MKATVTPYLKPSHIESEGYLKLRITKNRKSKYENLYKKPIRIKNTQWNMKSYRVRANHPDHEWLNNMIDSKLELHKNRVKGTTNSIENVVGTDKRYRCFVECVFYQMKIKKGSF